MKKIKKAIIYGLVVTAVINGFGSLINVLIYNLDKAITDILYIGPVSFPLFFFPCFFSALNYRDDLFKTVNIAIKVILKPAIFSFIIMYLLAFLHMILKKGFNLSYLKETALPFGVFAFLISLFSMLIVFLLNKPNKVRKKLNTRQIRPSLTLVLMHFLWVTLAYFMFLNPFGNSSFVKPPVLFSVFINGLSVALFVYFSFRYVYDNMKSKYWIISIYIIAVFIIPFMLLAVNSNITYGILVMKIKIFLSVLTPYFLFLTLVIHSYFIYLINKQEKQSLKQIGVEASLKYQQLKAQLSPHFLFNNISVLTGLIEENPEKAVAFSEDLARVYRYFLDKETHDLVLLTEELAFSHRYLELLKVRFENALVLNNEVKETKDLYIIPMALQQVLENVVKHNALTTENPITISLSIHNNFLIVSNTLQPKLTRVSTNQTGLENLQDRYSYFTDEKVDVIKNQNLFIIKLPLLNPEAQ